MFSRKRKYRPQDIDTHSEFPDDAPSHEEISTSALFIQAHEADLIHGPQAASAAQSLEVLDYGRGGMGSSLDGSIAPVHAGHKIGDALIRWGVETHVQPVAAFPGDEESNVEAVNRSDKDLDEKAIWVDRYVIYVPQI